MTIKLKPHHLLCLIGWRGRGYDQAFTDNFNLIAMKLKDAGMVRLVAGPDDICSCCPKLENADCVAESSAAIDERLLGRLGLREGDAYAFKQIIDLIKDEIAPHELEDICRGCSWLERGWCADALRRLV